MRNSDILLRRAIVEQGLKVGRPHVEFAAHQNDGRQCKTLSRLNKIQYRPARNGKPSLPRPRVPGWVLVSPPSGSESPILKKESYVTLWHTSLEEQALFPEKQLLHDEGKLQEIWRHREAMFSTLAPTDRDYYDSFLAELPPPDRRHDDSEALKDAFRILARTNWIPPRQGTVLHCPLGHQHLPEEYWLVVSNTQFNRRYPAPIFAYVPLAPIRDYEQTADECIAEGRLVWEISGTVFVAVEEHLDTFDVTQDWFSTCPACFDPRSRPHKWLIETGESPTCVRCDEASAQWPEEIAELASEPLGRVLKRILTYLRGHS